MSNHTPVVVRSFRDGVSIEELCRPVRGNELSQERVNRIMAITRNSDADAPDNRAMASAISGLTRHKNGKKRRGAKHGG